MGKVLSSGGDGMGKRRNRKHDHSSRLVLACGLLVIALRLFPAPLQQPVDLPAADQPEAFPLPLENTLLSFSESAVPDLTLLQQTPMESKPVFTPSPSDYQGTGTIYFKNETDYPVNLNNLLKQDCPVTLGSEGVQVLIMHTHGTEAYTPSAAHPYTASGEYRTTDSSANVLRVGEEICNILNQRGISALHSTTLNDYPAYNGSYNRALKDINHYVEANPSIQLIIDVHRDAIASGSTYYKTAAEVDGKQTAQLMFVTGTDAGGLTHDHWQENLTFQAQLHHRLNSACPGIMRPMSIRASRFNQHVRIGSMLLEVGACGNTLEEALAAAEIFANTLADTLSE